MDNLRIKCDRCDWFILPAKHYANEIKKWHNVTYPKCHGSIIITDQDMRIFRLFRLLSIVSKIINVFTLGLLKKETIHVDSAPLRK
jgi:hypothetical protein